MLIISVDIPFINISGKVELIPIDKEKTKDAEDVKVVDTKKSGSKGLKLGAKKTQDDDN
jgi:hypothetical protein